MKAEFFPWISSFGGVAFETQPLFTEQERENVAIARGWWGVGYWHLRVLLIRVRVNFSISQFSAEF